MEQADELSIDLLEPITVACFLLLTWGLDMRVLSRDDICSISGRGTGGNILAIFMVAILGVSYYGHAYYTEAFNKCSSIIADLKEQNEKANIQLDLYKATFGELPTATIS